MARRISPVLLADVLAMVIATAANADVTISEKASANMSCSAGMCSPTAKNAVLNATDLATMLASGDVAVTTGSGATNIVVKDGFSWTSTARLTLDAMQSVEFDKPVTVAGSGSVTITTNDGGSGGDLLFCGKGNLTFWDLSSSLIVNGNSYTLVGDIKTLAADIAANPSGFYALANDYDASVDGTYSSAPVAEVDGTVEGLGHSIDRLKIAASGSNLGLFAIARGLLRDMRITHATIIGDTDNAGILVAGAFGATIVNCSASGAITLSGTSEGGGLVSGGNGILARSHADVSIRITGPAKAGGLVGGSDLSISDSYATGRVAGGDGSFVGGLIGQLGIGLGGEIAQSYATGKVSGGSGSIVGGLVGNSGASTIDDSYATGSAETGGASALGGFIGAVQSTSIHRSYSIGRLKGKMAGGFLGSSKESTFSADYWDTDTSGERNRRGCGGHRCGAPIRGLTTEEFQSGLPEGFDPGIWGEKPDINGGFPYLLENRPS